MIIISSAQISLTLSCHPSLSSNSSSSSSGLHPVSTQSCCMYIRGSRLAFAWPCEGVHKSTSLMSSSLLLQQCSTCLVHLIWIALMMGGRWPYSCCFVGVLPAGLVQYCSQHSCVVAVKLFHESHPNQFVYIVANILVINILVIYSNIYSCIYSHRIFYNIITFYIHDSHSTRSEVRCVWLAKGEG